MFERRSELEWQIKPFGRMRVPGVIFASEVLLRAMDAKVYEQVTNVAMLPGIVDAPHLSAAWAAHAVAATPLPSRIRPGATSGQDSGAAPSARASDIPRTAIRPPSAT